jgi:tetratricopeptide (TPR) repeat protein
LHSSYTDMLAAKGVVYLDQANYTEIIKYYDKAIMIDPNIETYLKLILLFLQVHSKDPILL